MRTDNRITVRFAPDELPAGRRVTTMLLALKTEGVPLQWKKGVPRGRDATLADITTRVAITLEHDCVRAVW